jgi:eukaryotic-like serine/threonine-protein kinase
MANDPKQQKTAILGDVPPEVQQALNKGRPQSAPVSSSQATMMMDSAQHPSAQGPAPGQPVQRQMVVPTMMQQRPSGELPQVRKPRKQSTAGRWIAGPIIAAVFAGGTVAIAHVAIPYGPNSSLGGKKPQGHLRLQTDPPGATVTVDGKPWNHFTPTLVDGDIGSTLHIGFKLDGYEPKETDVYISEGEHPFNTKLTPSASKPAPPPSDSVASARDPKEHHHHSSSSSSSSSKPVKEEGHGSINIKVRPWAIVYVDGTRLRQTPVTDYQLGAGKHVIELVNEGKNRREKIGVTLKNGETQSIERDWDK